MAYHGDLEKKAAMEKQRGAAETSDNFKGRFSKEFLFKKYFSFNTNFRF